jgi:cell division protein FtsW
MTAHTLGYPPDLSPAARRVAPWDLALLSAVVMLLGLGAVMVYSATINESAQLTGSGETRLIGHLVHVSLGTACLLFGTFFPYRAWRRLVYPGLAIVAVLLVIVLLFGKTAGNARRWIALPGFSLQPAEMAKLMFILFLAHSLAKKAGRIRRFAVAFLHHLAVCSGLILLCLFQPDFGTCVLLVVLMFVMLFVAGTRTSHIMLFLFVGGFLLFQAVAANDMRLGRVMAWIDPWAYRSERGYQLVNALVAIGSGGVTGQGVGYGGQTLTGYLPEGATDFVLAVTAEQMGLLGVGLVALLFAVILVRGLATALAARDDFGKFLAFGVTLLIGVQAVINMLVNVALIPTKGLTLPFVSYGGSSMLVCCLGIGILLNVSRDARIHEFQELVPEAAPLPEPPAPRQQGGKPKPKRKKAAAAQKLEEVLK